MANVSCPLSILLLCTGAYGFYFGSLGLISTDAEYTDDTTTFSSQLGSPVLSCGLYPLENRHVSSNELKNDWQIFLLV